MAALDSVSRIGLSREDEPVRAALDWLADRQEPGGLWRVTYAKEGAAEKARERQMKPWVSLAICRVFARLYADGSAPQPAHEDHAGDDGDHPGPRPG